MLEVEHAHHLALALLGHPPRLGLALARAPLADAERRARNRGQEERRRDGRNRRDHDAVPSHVLAHPVGRRLGSRNQRPAVEVVPNVRREVVGGRVALAALLPHRLQRDPL
ncbi:MAG: hypothetical protein ACK559_25360, partial [bacterium]